MTRQLEQKKEQKEAARRDQIVKVLEYGLAGALENQGIQLVGVAIRYDAWDCLMTIKVEVGNRIEVCFVGSDSMMNCFLKAYSEARNGRLKWRPCKYHAK